MQHTTNYNLSQYDATDRVTRDAFNADNLAIDAALKANADAASAAQSTANAASAAAGAAQSTADTALAAAQAAASSGAWVKLLEYTLPEDAEAMVVDVSGIDFTQYVELRILPELYGTGTKTPFFLTYNDCTNYYVGTGTTSTTTYAARFGNHYNNNPYSGEAQIFLIHDAGLVTYSHAFCTRADFTEFKAACYRVTPSTLTSLHIAESTISVRAGSTVRLYGLKK